MHGGHRMQLTPTEWEVLEATADDVEDLEQIYINIRHLTPVARLSEVANAIRSLVERGLLAARIDENGQPPPAPNDLSYVWRAWFERTPDGRDAWASSAP